VSAIEAVAGAMDDTGAAAVAPAANKQHWPSQLELEKWLMNTAKDGDPGATFLRKILQMNPAYGSYLASDNELAGIVQLFAKRFRTKILSSDNAVQRLRDDTVGKVLWEPLCEICWRVVGHIFYTLIDLEESENLPLPKEALGQVRMLLNTNVALSKKFNDMRRAYLKELCSHRDRERVLSQRVQAAVASLQEDPVMFYEPLDFVLDECTKKFVCEVIEERLKLDMQVKVEAPPPVKQEVDTAQGDREKAKMAAEMKMLRTQAAKAEAAAEKAQQETRRANAELDAVRKQKDADIEALQKELEVQKHSNRELSKSCEEQANRLASKQPEQIREVVKEKPVYIESPPRSPDNTNTGNNNKKIKELQAEVDELREKIKKLETDKKEQAAQLEKARSDITDLESKPKEAPVAKKPAKKEEEKQERVKVVKDSSADDLRKQLEEQLEVVKQLREANKALEKALQEGKEKPKYRGPKGETQDIDAEIKAAVAKITEQHKKEMQKLGDENDRLREQLDRARLKPEPTPRKEVPEEEPKKQKAPKQVVYVADPGQEDEKWKAKCKELQDQYEEALQDKEQLEHQVRLLLDKIKKIGGAEAVAEIMAEIKLDKIPPRKKRKLKAWERLYEDAKRRIADMQRRRAELEAQEKRLLIHAASRVTDRRSMRVVEHLTHLHKASIAQQKVFQEALTRFHQQTASIGTDNEEEGTSGDEAAGALFEFFSKTVGLGSADNWKPELIAAEFQRLRSENRMLSEEIERLRGEIAFKASGGAGGRDRAGKPKLEFMVSTTSLSKSQLFRAELGRLGTGPLSPSMASLHGRMDTDGSPESGSGSASRTVSPVAAPQAVPSASAPPPAVRKPGVGRRAATPPVSPPPPHPILRSSSSSTFGQSVPWRQVAGGSPTTTAGMTWPPVGDGKRVESPAATGQPPLRTLSSLTRSNTLPSQAPGAEMPWRRGGPAQAAPGCAAGAGDSAFGVSLPPDWVLGRVPSSGTLLEPIPSKSSPRTTDGMPFDPSLSPARRQMQSSPFRQRPPSAPSAPSSSGLRFNSAAALDNGMCDAPSPTTTLGSARSAQQLLPPASRIGAAKDVSSGGYRGVKPKASGLCITALRSQEHLLAMSTKLP